MRVKSISGTVTTEVVLGNGIYGNNLTVTQSGAVEPASYGSIAVNAPSSLHSAKLTNQGQVIGGIGTPGTAANRQTGGTGGIGVDLACAGAVTNGGTIAGGAGGYGYTGGAGGIAVQTSAKGVVKTTGTISGGAGGAVSKGGRGARGGVGVMLGQASKLTNSGIIGGGSGAYGTGGGGAGAAGVVLSASDTLVTTGGIYGGNGGGGGKSGDGGDGAAAIVATAAASITNSGTVRAGTYGESRGGASAAGAAGIVFDTPGTLVNHGVVIGGGSGYGYQDDAAGGGTGVDNVDMCTNSGTIAGGAGGGSDNFSAGAGGLGISLATGGTLVNSGSIEGGKGGSSHGKYQTSVAGVGGVGLAIYANDVVTNTGTIIGGAGGAGGYFAAAGGAGVDISGGTLTSSGTIAGGAPGKAGGSQGDAVLFGAQAGTLEISTRAVFSGDIVGNVAVNDVVVLEDKGSGTLSGFGTTVTGLTTIEENANAHWTLAGTITGSGSIELGGNAQLTLNGISSIATLAFEGKGLVNVEIPSELTSSIAGFGTADTIDLIGIQATSLKYASHTLTLFSANGSLVDTLTFDGQYSASDFALQSTHYGTDLIYDGQAAPTELMSADFLPPMTENRPGEPYLAVGGRVFDHEGTWPVMYPWHVPVPG
jgi:hypothetical protein